MLPFSLHGLNLDRIGEIERITDISSSGSHLTPRNLPVDHESFISNSSMIYGPFFNKHAALRVVVGIICCLSMLGAILIILSYCLIKDIRTKSRQILVHLSFADFGVACSNFIGVTVYFDQYIRHCPMDTSNVNNTLSLSNKVSNGVNSALSCQALNGLCRAQAFFAAFSTLASVLWTLSLAVYIYCLVVHSSKKVHHKVLYVACIFCWGLPLLISLWLVSTDRLGYSPHGGSGWCTLKIDDYTGKQDTFAVVFGNDLWIYLTFIMVTILYFTTHCYIKFQLKDSNPFLLQGHNMAAVSKADTKFILIPFFFLLLRIWTMILVILLVYAHVNLPLAISYILLYAAGIGDSGQGFVNALLFCVFTPKVRDHFVSKGRCSIPLKSCSTITNSQGSLSSTFPVMKSKSKKCAIPKSESTQKSQLLQQQDQ